MQEYVDRLELELVRAARREASLSGAGRLMRATTAHPGRTVALTGLAVAAAVLAGLSIAGGAEPQEALALAPLREPATDVSAVGHLTRALQGTGVDFSQARPIPTPYGTGYLMPRADGSGLCLAVPDPVDGYGEACAGNADIAQHGLFSTLLAQPQAAAQRTVMNGSEFVAVLPAGAGDPVVQFADGTATTLPIADGVASTVVHDGASVTYSIGATTTTVPLPASIVCAKPTNAPATATPPANDNHFTRQSCTSTPVPGG